MQTANRTGRQQKCAFWVTSASRLSAILLFAVVFAEASPLFGQAVTAPGCGAADEQFQVKTDKRQHPEAKLDATKASVYLIQDDREFQAIPKPVVRMGLDGKWIGATQGTSYLFATVEPGEHHLCASWQGTILFGAADKTAALHFTAEPGKTYFFAARNRMFHDSGILPMKLQPLDSDEGQLLISRFAYSSSELRK